MLTAFVLRGDAAHDDRPIKRLFGFERLHGIKPGESREAVFSSTPHTLSVVERSSGKRILPAADEVLTVQVGDIVNPASHRFQLLGEEHVLLEENVAVRQAMATVMVENL